MDNPRAEKVAVVDEVRERLAGSDASVITEYRGLSVADLAQLRASLAAVGGDYKIFKNTLVRLAVAPGDHGVLEPLLTGPTAIAFVHGDVSAVAKALRDFSRTNPHLVIKGGLLEGQLLSASDLSALAELPSRDVLLAQLAGAIAAPLRQLAGLLKALPQNLAYGLSALVEQRGGLPEAAPAVPATGEADAAAPAPPPAEDPEPEAVAEAGQEAEAAVVPEAAPDPGGAAEPAGDPDTGDGAA
jgi:large subunit ribosomal protein L10